MNTNTDSRHTFDVADGMHVSFDADDFAEQSEHITLEGVLGSKQVGLVTYSDRCTVFNGI